MTPHRIGFLYWPGTKALTLSLAEEALRVAQRVHPEVVYELVFLQAEPLVAGDWRLPGEPWTCLLYTSSPAAAPGHRQALCRAPAGLAGHR